ncbi:MAG: hypothetical protein FJ386_13900 [Verrucomicrobia bacterium]|nr:hypothetical protein [Verrucomicrobiota bacterium]
MKKAVNWALRATGRRSPALHAAACALSRRLAASHNATSRWIGKDALRHLSKRSAIKKPATQRNV